MKNNFKEINEVWFSPTGTTKKIVSAIAESIEKNIGENCELKKTSLTLPKEREDLLVYKSSDIVVLGVPVYAGRVPNILLKYLDTLEGNSAIGIPIVLYGNRNYDDALIELADIMREKGFKVVGAGAFIGEHSFSKILAKKRPNKDDIEKAKNFGLKISEKIKNMDRNVYTELKIKGNRPYRPYYRPKNIAGEFYDFRKIKPKTSDRCIDCKICVYLCPVGSIDLDDVSKINGICIKCGGCIKGCLTNAKYYDDENYLKHQHELEEEFQDRKEIEIFL